MSYATVVPSNVFVHFPLACIAGSFVGIRCPAAEWRKRAEKPRENWGRGKDKILVLSSLVPILLAASPLVFAAGHQTPTKPPVMQAIFPSFRSRNQTKLMKSLVDCRT